MGAGGYAGSLFCDGVLSVLSSFAIIMLRKRELVALLKFSHAVFISYLSYQLPRTLPDKRCLSHGMCLYQVKMTLHFLNDVTNDAESIQKIENYVIIASLERKTISSLINRNQVCDF